MALSSKTTKEANPKPPPKDDLRYEPTKAELEQDMRIDATPQELAAAMFGRHPPPRHPLTGATRRCGRRRLRQPSWFRDKMLFGFFIDFFC